MAVERNRASPIHQAAVCGTGIDYQTLAARPLRTVIERGTWMQPERTERRFDWKITHPGHYTGSGAAKRARQKTNSGRMLVRLSATGAVLIWRILSASDARPSSRKSVTESPGPAQAAALLCLVCPEANIKKPNSQGSPQSTDAERTIAFRGSQALSS